MAAAAKHVQDLPPAGGFGKIPWKRIPAKQLFKGWMLIGGYLGMTAGAACLYYLSYKKVHRENIENRSAEFALYPMLLAERDRMFLKHLRQNRDQEAELMKNVEGWTVGTWYGEKIYETTNKFIEPRIQDFYVHDSTYEFCKRKHLALWG